MYGQKNLIKKIDKLCENEFPHLLILVGDNSEKIDIYKYINKKIESKLNLCDVAVDEVREVISNSYKVKDKILYIFEDSEKMSMYAQNALLKITEEPPKNCYFIISFKNKDQVIPTIKSRGFILEMDKYEMNELLLYIKDRYSINDMKISEIINIVSNPIQIDTIVNYDLDSFFELVDKVIKYLPSVSIANALKISKSIKLKDDGEGYELDLFLKCLLEKYTSCYDRSNIEEMNKVKNTVIIINNALHDLESSKYSKQSIFDSVILGVHRVWNY